MSSSNSISDGFSQDVGSGNIVNVIIVVFVIIFPISLAALLRLSHRKMSKDGFLRIRGKGECNGVTGWKSFSEEDLFIAFSRSRTMLILWGLGKKMFQESLSSWSKTNDESRKWFVSEQVWIINSGSLSLLFYHSKLWLRSS